MSNSAVPLALPRRRAPGIPGSAMAMPSTGSFNPLSMSPSEYLLAKSKSKPSQIPLNLLQEGKKYVYKSGSNERVVSSLHSYNSDKVKLVDEFNYKTFELPKSSNALLYNFNAYTKYNKLWRPKKSTSSRKNSRKQQRRSRSTSTRRNRQM